MKFYFIIIALVVSSAAMAERPYGMAGCGWGSQVQGKDGNQILAVTTNETGTQTFAISSGTSNCVTASEQTAMIRNFIEANYAALVTDMAKGQGDTIKTLSNFYGCESASFANEVKSHYETIAPATEDATRVMANINTMIETTPALSTTCTHAI